MRLVGIVAMLVLAGFVAACGSDASVQAGTVQAGTQPSDRPVVVATTNILGDVAENIVGDQFEVVTIMPVGSDPHTFQPSAQDVAALEEASAIIANGAAFEEGLLDAVDAAVDGGTPVFFAMSVVAPIDGDHDDDHDDHGDDKDGDDEHGDDHGDDDHGDGEHGDDHGDDDHGDDDHDDDEHGDDHGDEDHGDDDHGDDEHDEHDHGDGEDPHFFTDPARMAVAADGIVEFLVANVDGIDDAALRADGAAYVDALESLDTEVESLLAAIPDERRVLVTNHQVFAYFADRFGFEVVGTVVPDGSSSDGVSGQRLAELAVVLEQEGVSVVFADTSSPVDLAETLASEVGDVAVIQLFSESLGDAESDGATYITMVRSNARRIADALAN